MENIRHGTERRYFLGGVEEIGCITVAPRIPTTVSLHRTQPPRR